VLFVPLWLTKVWLGAGFPTGDVLELLGGQRVDRNAERAKL
jgi:hypothetical protein